MRQKTITLLIFLCVLCTIFTSGCKYSFEVEDGAWDDAGRCILEGEECKRVVIEAQKTNDRIS